VPCRFLHDDSRMNLNPSLTPIQHSIPCETNIKLGGEVVLGRLLVLIID
jgi:hypothetical protein